VLGPEAFFAAQDTPKQPLTWLVLQEAVQPELL
jgi:hypothetical protein